MMEKMNIKRSVRNGLLRPLGTMVFRLFPSLGASFRKHKEETAFRREAEQYFAQGKPLPAGASREGFYQANKQYSVSLSEYLYQYEFYKLTDQERAEFISRAQMRALAYKLRMKYPKESYGLPRFKEQYLGRFTELGLIHRRWLYVPECSYEEFASLLGSMDCIIKPADGSLGLGVKKILRQDDPEQIRALYETCRQGNMLLEECARGCDELQAFHPQSLNTIRFVTMAFEGRAVAFGSFFRMGVGDMVIDNAHAGGLYAQINLETGVIESDGITTEGLRVSRHPDTGLTIKGTPIPHWGELVDACVNAARQTRNIITGWDVIVTHDGRIELIEVNNRPDFDLMQSPLRTGVKRKVLDMLSALIGQPVSI